MIQGEINVLLLLLLLRGVVVDPHVLPHMLINTSACGWASASSGEIFDLIPSVEKNKMLWVGACCLPSFFFFLLPHHFVVHMQMRLYYASSRPQITPSRMMTSHPSPQLDNWNLFKFTGRVCVWLQLWPKWGFKVDWLFLLSSMLTNCICPLLL